MNPYSTVPIYTILKKRMNLYFEEKGESRFANGEQWLKMILFGLIAGSGYWLLLGYGESSLSACFGYYLIYILGSALFVVNVAHDASHRALFKNKTANQFISYSWNLLGISETIWEIKHHSSHHIYTNLPHKDVDIEESPLLRFSATYQYKPYYRYQYLYAPFLYAAFGVFIVYVRDFILVFSEKLKSHNRKKINSFFIARLFLMKLTFLGFSFILPLVLLPFVWWKLLIIYLASLAIAGALMLLVLVVPHINEEAAVDENNIAVKNQNEWALHQIHSTVDSSVNSRMLNWLTGGLNTHLIHHLFPNICHIHYRELTKILKEELQKNGIPYKEKSLFSTLACHFRYLKKMGQAPEAFNKVPFPA